MNIVLSKEELEKHSVTIVEFVNLLKAAKLIEDVISHSDLLTLEKKGLVKLNEEEFVVRDKGQELIDLFKIESFNTKTRRIKKIVKASSRRITDDIKDHLKEYRGVFKGLKAGAMGDPTACREKLSRWFENNPEYTMKDVINAAKTYVNSVNDIRYLRRADYFIYKKEQNGEEVSTLSAIVDDVENYNSQEDWLTNFT